MVQQRNFADEVDHIEKIGGNFFVSLSLSFRLYEEHSVLRHLCKNLPSQESESSLRLGLDFFIGKIH